VSHGHVHRAPKHMSQRSSIERLPMELYFSLHIVCTMKHTRNVTVNRNDQTVVYHEYCIESI
jgi:hypothetical protein